MAAATIEPKVDVKDVQGIIIHGYKRLPYGKFAFLRIEKPAEARRWLERVLPHVTRADQKPGETAFNIGFTYLGLKRMGLGRAVHTFPQAFREGMANPARSLQLGDTGESDPKNWQVGGGNTREVHVLLLIYGESRKAADDFYTNLMDGYLSAVFTNIFLQDAARDSNMRESFGFRDGIAQPAIEGIQHLAPKGQDLLKLGEFLLGYPDEYGYVPPSPQIPAAMDTDSMFQFLKDPATKDFGRNGTYLVWRKMVQDVEGFSCFVRSHAEKTEQEEEWVAAKLMGRWRSGAPLVLAPTRNEESLAGSDDFLYAGDPRGKACPITSHVRRANPRDTLGKAAKRHLTNRHRIIRRGIPFKDQDKQGLIFIGINADISRQFEFIQQSWLNHPQFGGMFNDRDVIASINDKNGGATFPRDPVRLRLSPPSKPFITVRGGGYFFLPSYTALKFLAREDISERPQRDGRTTVVEEHPLVNEAEQIDEIITLVREFMARHYPIGVRPALRQAHAKTHGVVKAEFRVESDLPANLCYGVFQPGSSYDAWIRFSNSSSSVEDDRKGGVRGMAIKLMGIAGKKLLQEEANETTQDFVLINSPVFFSPDVPDFLAFLRATMRFGDRFGPLVYALGRPMTRIPNAFRMRKLASPVMNVLTATYWSASPYRLGPFAVKYTARPWDRDRWWRKGSSPDFLHDTMKQYLAKYDARFDFMVQLQADPEKMPIEDATVEWNERDSPFIKVATMRIPRQAFDSDQQKQFGENLSFTPWHSLPEHQPIGSMNRIRKATYQAMSELRHQMNQVPKQEPS